MTITVELTTAVSAGREYALSEFCAGIGVPAPFHVAVTGRTLQETQQNTPQIVVPGGLQPDALFVGASRLRPTVPTYVRADEDYWFNHLDAICAGRIGVEQMPGISDGDARCFVDATIGEHINLRQLLALYDTIYVSPPLLENHQKFLDKQALAEADLLDLIASDRLKILMTQAEERLNIPFLSAAVERSPTAIIGRRTAAAMLIADIVHMADVYRLNDCCHYAEVGQLSRAIAEKANLPADKMLQFMLWPVEARRGAVGALLDRGTKGMPAIGVGPYFAMLIKKLTGKDLDLETLVVSEKVHIAHAIGATCFPMREEPGGLHGLANMMGDALNFFRSFNTEIAASWAGNVDRKIQGKVLLPPLPIIEFDAAIPVKEVLAATARPVMRNRGRALFSRLAEMNDEQRTAEVQDLNAQLRNFGKPCGILSLDTADTAVSLVALATSFLYPPLAGLAHIGTQLAEIGRRNPTLDRFLEDLAVDLFPSGTKKRELDFLSRINRVASLKTKKVS